MLILLMLLGVSQTTKPAPAGPPRSFPATIKCVLQKILFSGFGGEKGTSSMGKIGIAEVLRLRATSAVLPKKSVRRSAQDDELVSILKKNILNKHRSHADSN
jgi:hypothetical protein